jgi:hypothetical protein
MINQKQKKLKMKDIKIDNHNCDVVLTYAMWLNNQRHRIFGCWIKGRSMSMRWNIKEKDMQP